MNRDLTGSAGFKTVLFPYLSIYHETAVRHSHARANVCTYTHTVWKTSVLSLGSFRDKLYK